MKQVFRRKGEILVYDIPAPAMKDGSLLIKTSHSLISKGPEFATLKHSSELVSSSIKNPDIIRRISKKITSDGIKSMYKSIVRKFSESPLGYSCSGLVIEKGAGAGNINVGDRVACAGAGYANHAEINCIPKNLVVKIPDSISFEEAALVGLGAIAVQGVRRGECKSGETVVVMGLGLIGQITCQILNAIGCNTIGSDIAQNRVELAASLGLKKVLTGDTVNSVLKSTHNEGADTVIICAATSPSLIKDAIKMCRTRGKIVIVGKVSMDIPWHLAYTKEISILMSCSHGLGRYTRNMDEFFRLIDEKKINIKGLIGKIFDLKDISKAYKELEEGKLISALIKYPQETNKSRILKLPKRNVVNKEKINVGLVGIGGFARITHLPNIKKIKDFNLYSLGSNSGLDAKKAAEEFDAKYYATDHLEMVKDENLDALLITTRHDSHFSIAMDALKAKKHVLVEKPVALNLEELEKITEAVKGSGVVFTVGFNRRYSELATKAKRYLENKKGPHIIVYRVNAGELPFGHWCNDPKMGGGRIIGEACHFFDFFNWFIDAEPKSIQTQGISSDFKNILDENNIISTVKYADGSIAMLCYTELGHNSLSKERIEIFRGGSNAIIDDYQKLVLDGKKTTYRKKKKGHYTELLEFLKAIKGKDNCLLDMNDAYKATICTFKALESFRNGEIIKF